MLQFHDILERFLSQASAGGLGAAFGIAKHCYEWLLKEVSVRGRFDFYGAAARAFLGMCMGWAFWQAALLYDPRYDMLAAAVGGFAGGWILQFILKTWAKRFARRAEEDKEP